MRSDRDNAISALLSGWGEPKRSEDAVQRLLFAAAGVGGYAAPVEHRHRIAALAPLAAIALIAGMVSVHQVNLARHDAEARRESRQPVMQEQALNVFSIHDHSPEADD